MSTTSFTIPSPDAGAPATSTATEVDHVAEALNRLCEQFKNKDNIAALVTSLVEPTQDIEEALQDCLAQRSVDTATGVQLTAIGNVVGQPRAGLVDADYRPLIRARIAANRSRGVANDLLRVARLVLDDVAASLILDQQGTAAVVLRVEEVIGDDDLMASLLEFLQDSVAAGVRIILESLTALEDESFTLATATFLDNAATAGNTTLTVASTAGFPDTGALDIDVGLAVEETVTYSGKTSTKFIGVSALASNHALHSCVQLSGAPGMGLNTGVGGVDGGKLSTAND